jgi:hypothetical protein
MYIYDRILLEIFITRYKKRYFGFCCVVFFSAATFLANASATPNTSLGDNPVWAVGGTKSSGTQTVSVITAPVNQDLLVTDVALSITGYGNSATSCVAAVTLQDSS